MMYIENEISTAMVKTPITLSVCVPTFERGMILAVRVRTWLAAAPSDFEIVVSDNASQDGSFEALQAIRDERLVLVRNAENVGGYENQLRAFERAHGKYLMQLTDKDELIPAEIASAVEILRSRSVACGEFKLNYDVTRGDKIIKGCRAYAYARFGFRYNHPSGHFFSSAVLKGNGILERMRGLDAHLHPFATDWLVSLCLQFGPFLSVGRAFVRQNHAPYEGLVASTTYRSERTYWFTPEVSWEVFEAYVCLLRHIDLGCFLRLGIIFSLVRHVVFPQVTRRYREFLSDGGFCAWYGVRLEWAKQELARGLEGEFFKRAWNAVGISFLESIVIRLASLTRCRHAVRQWYRRRRCGR